jgi:drug/metabolite transporter (DMT)-like permease
MNACPIIVLLPLFVLTYKNLRGNLKPVFLSALMIGLAFTFYANALVETTVVRATLLFYLNPTIGTIIGLIWLSEKLTKARVISILIAMLGLILLLSKGDDTALPLNVGDLYGLISGLFWALGATLLNRWPSVPIIPLTGLIYLIATILSFLFALTLYNNPIPEVSLIISILPHSIFWSIIVLLPGFMIIFKVSQFLFPGRVGLLMMSEVIVAIISASILLPSETMLPWQWFGALAIILAGLIEVVFGYTKERKTK